MTDRRAESAAVDAQNVGIEELVARLELELAIPPPPRGTQRIMQLAAASGWDASDDPVGAATATLRLADALRLEGATRELLPARWRRSLDGALDVPGALADRIDRVMRSPLAALRPRSLRFVGPAPCVPARVRGLLDALARCGWTLRPRATPVAGDDLRVSVVRGRSPAAVAETVATLVSDRGEVTWVAPDGLVAQALAARGAPGLGLRSRTGAHRGILRTVVALACAPQDPEDLLDLLGASATPIPRPVVQALTGALCEYPAWSGEDWDVAVASVRGSSPEADRALAWIDAMLAPLSATDGGVPLDPLRARVESFGALCVAHPAGTCEALAALCGELCALLAVVPAAALTRGAIDGLVRLAEAAVDPGPADVAQVGGRYLPALDAVTSPVSDLVVWNAAVAPSDPFAAILPSERRALRAAGVNLPDRAARVAAWTEDLLHAIAQTRGHVWLCLPDTDDRGEPVDDPPWRAALDAWLRVPAGAVTVPAVTVSAIPAPQPRARWVVPPTLLRERAAESPSSAATLLGCSFRYALRHQGQVPDGVAPQLPADGLLYGRLAHAVFEATWWAQRGVPDPQQVADAARREADRWIDARARTLTLPSARGRRRYVVEAVARAAATLAASLRSASAEVAHVELRLGRGLRLAGLRWNGRADLVLGPTPAVLDLKWSGALHRGALAQGTALQLALYAWMLRGRNDLASADPWPAVGYLVVTTGTLHGTSDLALPGVDRVAGPSPAATVRAAARALTDRVAERSRGELYAPGVLPAPPRDGVTDGFLTVAPPCRHCAYTALCGRGGAP